MAEASARTRSLPATVLLVEDNRLDVDLTEDAFRTVWPGTALHSVFTGEEALRYLEQCSEDGSLPDLILLDLKLPGMSGQEILRRVKGARPWSRIPILIFSSSDHVDDRAGSYDGGANGYLVKPRTFQGFLDVVRSIGDFWLAWNARPPRV
ncbi:MAG: response regulator [Gemmatimonadales bacterium]|nr:MAG: response regulator [Gemmatimonadales bacterium]